MFLLLPASLVAAFAACDGTSTPPPASAGPGPDPTATDGPPPPPVADASTDAAIGPDAALGPKRLKLVDTQVIDDQGKAIRLRGANVEGISDADAEIFAKTIGFNLVRMRISFEAPNRDDDDPTGFTAAYRAAIDGWVESLRKRGVWIVLEMRGDDPLTNDPNFYDTTKAPFFAYQRAWTYLANRYKDTDYIAGYGLLAEPSADKAKVPDAITALVTFQKTLMDTITRDAGDTKTPFFVGPNYNYDAMQYRSDAYFNALAGYKGRLFYAVNVLMPKPWIQDGTAPDGSRPAYPILPAATDFSSLLAVKQGENFKVPDDLEKIFNARRTEMENFDKLLGPNFFGWYLSYPLAFRAAHKVPMYVDQFGAPTNATGQLDYERDLVSFCESQDLHWTRWSFNAGGQASRKIVGNDGVRDFYRDLIAGLRRDR